MKYKSLIPRTILAALLTSMQIGSLLSLYIMYDFTKLNASSIVQLPGKGYSLQADPQLWLKQILSHSWIWGSAVICILLAVATLVLLLLRRGAPSVPVAITSAGAFVGHVIMFIAFALGCADPTQLELVCYSMIRSTLQTLSILPQGDWRAYLGLVMIAALCVFFALSAAIALALTLTELILLIQKKNREIPHA